jgi:branched-chain amino acid transport system permease protein
MAGVSVIKAMAQKVRDWFAPAPTLAWLVAMLAAVLLERWVGPSLAPALGLSKVPMLLGFVIALKKPFLIPGTLAFVGLIYIIPITLVTKAATPIANRMAQALIKMPLVVTALVHLALLYVVLHIWADVSDSRDITLRFTLIAVMVTLSLNIINGYMGEFSCSHPGFMALGAYAGSVFTVGLFAKDRLFGAPLLPPELGPFFFPLALIFGGLVAAAGALIVAIPSFRTRGDYLAIISLAFTFIIKSVIENMGWVGGPRGLMGQPNWASLPVVFLICATCIWMINNFVTSILGKATNAVRDDETAAEAMTINTRRTKMTAFMFSAFWAGVAGALFAHVLRYVNPATFGIQKLAEVLAMVYFGGLNSVVGSVVGAVSISVLGEALRPLEIYKWIIIPLLLILVMIFRPTGLIAFREFNLRRILSPKTPPEGRM